MEVQSISVITGSAWLSQQASFCRERLILLDMILLETHGDSLRHLQVLLQAELGTCRLIWFHLSGGEVFHAVHEAVLCHLVICPQKLFKLFDLVGLGYLQRHFRPVYFTDVHAATKSRTVDSRSRGSRVNLRNTSVRMNAAPASPVKSTVDPPPYRRVRAR